MTGLIWFVQVVHYPLMGRVGREAFVAYEAAHTRRTTVVVGPLMVAEATTATWIALGPPAGVSPTAATVGLALVLVIWLSTAMLSVPCHRRLERGFDAATHARLVRTNWIRTAAWTARAVLVLTT
jgi:hypothetical protein